MNLATVFTLNQLEILPDDLKPIQLAIFWLMRTRAIEGKPMTVRTIAEDLGRETQHIYRAMKELLAAGIVSKCV